MSFSRSVLLDNLRLEDVIEESVRNLITSNSPEAVKQQAAEALNRVAVKRKNYQNGYYHPEIELEEDIPRGATAIKDGGAFYIAHADFAGIPFKFRIKKSGRSDLFERGTRVQKHLSLLQQRGALRGPGINPVLYQDYNNSLTVESFVEHQRLTDLLRDKTDEEKAEILEQSLLDTLEITTTQTALRDQKDEKGNFLLKRNYTSWDIFRNYFPGNYIVTAQDPSNQFMMDFAFRNNSLLKADFAKDNKVKRLKLLRNKTLRNLNRAFEEEFNSDYKTRQRYFVNKDSHTGNVLVDPHGQRLYCDFDYTFEDILEEPLAELVITSGIKDENVVLGLIERVYDKYKDKIGVSKEAFIRTFNKKLTEKTLSRAAWNVEMESRAESKDKAQLREQAKAYYSYALERLERQGLKKTLKAVDEFNQQYLKLERTDQRPNFDRTLSSMVSSLNIAALPELYSKKPLESQTVLAYGKKALITGLIATLSICGIKACKVKEPEQRPIDYLSPLYQISMMDTTRKTHKLINTNMSKEEIIGKLFETSSTNDLDKIINEYKPAIIPNFPFESRFYGVGMSQALDADLLKAIYWVGSSTNDHVLEKKTKERIAKSMLWNVNNPIADINRRGGVARPPIEEDDDSNLLIGGQIIVNAARYFDFNLGKTISSYVAGSTKMYEAMIKAGQGMQGNPESQNYFAYRNYLSEYDRKICDDILVKYLALKGVIEVPREPAPDGLFKSIKKSLFGKKDSTNEVNEVKSQQ